MAKVIAREKWGTRTVLKFQCPCGNTLFVPYFTNTCEVCNRDFNSSGQELAPRSQWGWDTGETVDEILAIDHMTPEELLNTED